METGQRREPRSPRATGLASGTDRHVHRRDIYFVTLVASTLVAIAGFLLGDLAATGTPAGGWRRIDLERLEMRLESGELLRHEAQWYAPLQK